MSQEGVVEPKRVDGNFWILKLGREKTRGCSIVQEIKILIDVEEWNPDYVIKEIQKKMLELEKRK